MHKRAQPGAPWGSPLRGIRHFLEDGAPACAPSRLSIRRLLMLAVFTAAFLGWVLVGNARADGSGPPSGGVPSISGTPDVGNVLTADPGSWSGDQPITYSYAWSDGQTGDTDTLSAGDVGESLTVTVTATNDAGQASSTSDSYGPVQQVAPVNGGAPSISGPSVEGGVLTADPGSWSGDQPITYSYACSDGQTGETDTLSPADVGEYLTVTVTASNDAGQSSSPSDSYGPVQQAAPVNNGAPSITGTAQQGDTLTVSDSGTWSNDPSFSYAWEDC